MRWSTMIELAPQLGITLSSSQESLGQEFLIRAPFPSLTDVLKQFQNIQQFFVSEEIIRRIAFEVCEDAFNEGVRILELRYSPFFMSQAAARSLTYEQIHRALVEGIRNAEKALPMAVGLIGIMDRTQPPSILEKICDFLLEVHETLVGVDLADREESFEPRRFAIYFDKLRKQGLHVTVHAGEAPYPGAEGSVIDAIDYLGAERIGHGVQIFNSPRVLEKVKSQGIALEICPLSNYLTRAFSSHFTHPVRKLFEAGIEITINSDDPGLFASNLTDEYEILQRVHRFTPEEFYKLNEISFRHSFISKEKTKFIWENNFGKQKNI